MINDIELMNKPQEYHMRIAQNSTIYHLRNRAINSLYITQMDMSFPQVIYKTICLLSVYSTNVLLFVPKSASSSGQCYVCVWGVKRAFSGDYSFTNNLENKTI